MTNNEKKGLGKKISPMINKQTSYNKTTNMTCFSEKLISQNILPKKNENQILLKIKSEITR